MKVILNHKKSLNINISINGEIPQKELKKFKDFLEKNEMGNGFDTIKVEAFLNVEVPFCDVVFQILDKHVFHRN